MYIIIKRIILLLKFNYNIIVIKNGITYSVPNEGFPI